MYTLLQTLEFQDWLDGLKEMRVDVSAGYRLYFTRRGQMLIVMLAGGDKASQKRDIKRAQRMARELELQS